MGVFLRTSRGGDGQTDNTYRHTLTVSHTNTHTHTHTQYLTPTHLNKKFPHTSPHTKQRDPYCPSSSSIISIQNCHYHYHYQYQHHSYATTLTISRSHSDNQTLTLSHTLSYTHTHTLTSHPHNHTHTHMHCTAFVTGSKRKNWSIGL